MAPRSSDSPTHSPKRTHARLSSHNGKRRELKPIDVAASQMPDYGREADLLSAGSKVIAGVDEAGRGPLAGPVVAAAVALDIDRIPPGINDSKKLCAAEREELYQHILANADVGVGSASAAEIDRFNIRGATLIAMHRAVCGLSIIPCHTLIDGRDLPPHLSCSATALVAGDALSLSIAAASIVAKVTRDRMMRRACERFPGYGFSRHMGYGTVAHLDAIARLGPVVLHRMSFRPLRGDRSA